ncbi:MAG: hypothetical protein WDN10_02820 [bacterium]
MPPEEDESSLERARKKLYAPQMDIEAPRPDFRGRDARDLPHAWEDAPEVIRDTHRPMRFATKFFIFALVFFIVAAGAAAYLFLSGSRSVSADNIAIALQGPTSVAGGDTVPLSVTVTNRNPVAVTNAILTIDFPEGTRSADNVLTPLPRYSENLGALAPGASVTRSVKAVIFGKGGDQVALPVTLSYGAQNSNATFIKQSSYSLAISTAPISVSVATLSEAVSGKPITLNVTVRSNATTPVSGVLLQAAYPFGFSVSSTSIAPEGNTFPLGTLQPGDTKEIKITGMLAGGQGDTRIFRFTVGTGSPTNAQALSLAYMTQDATVKIAAPFLATTLTLNGSTSTQSTASAGAPIQGRVSWKNALSTAITNASIEIALSGAALDPGSVRVDRGFFRSADNTIVFNGQTDPSLSSLSPGESGIGSFSFSTLSEGNLRNPTLTLTTSVAGTRVGESSVPESVSSTMVSTIRLVTALTLDSYGLYTAGPFLNMGPFPPVANSETTYTIVWNVKNSANALAGASVSATLPPYVRFTGATSPADGSVSYNPSSRTVTWSAGDIAAGASAQAMFQIGFTPSVNQRGGSPVLVNAPTITGVDRFAQVTVTGQGSVVTTQMDRDPAYRPDTSDVQ